MNKSPNNYRIKAWTKFSLHSLTLVAIFTVSYVLSR